MKIHRICNRITKSKSSKLLYEVDRDKKQESESVRKDARVSPNSPALPFKTSLWIYREVEKSDRNTKSKKFWMKQWLSKEEHERILEESLILMKDLWQEDFNSRVEEFRKELITWQYGSDVNINIECYWNKKINKILLRKEK